MHTKTITGSIVSLLAGLALTAAIASAAPSVEADEPADAAQIIVTEYSDLWTGTIAAQPGIPVKWYVHVPEETEPKGCGATIKIPGLGWGTDSHNKEEGHIVLETGDNFIYEFTPDAAGDILYTCWMGSGCHHNYIHITEDGSYSVPKPDAPTGLSAVWNAEDVTVLFTAPEAPEGAQITRYKVIATDEDGVKIKGSGTESPVILTGLDVHKTYTITVTTIGTSGTSDSSEAFVLAPAAEPASEEPSGQEAQVIVTEYDGLWADNITVKAGIPVRWYVHVPAGTALLGCGKTIKIPGLGWGTDSHNKEEGHLTLAEGENFVYEFTPETAGDILFTCWMGSGCHYNYLHVTEDGIARADAKPGSGAVHDDASYEPAALSTVTTETTTSATSTTAQTTTTTAASTTAAQTTTDNPKTGSSHSAAVPALLIPSLVLLFLTRKHK